MYSFNKIILFLFAISVIFLSCSEEKNEERPTNILSRETFTEMLLELQLIEAHINEVRIDQVYIRDSANNFNQEIFTKHNSSLEEFKRTMDYYTTKPGDLQEIYDNVLTTLSEMEAELVDVKMDHDIISPIGRNQVTEMIANLPIASIYFDSTYTAQEIKDSLFRYLIQHPTDLDTSVLNLASFQRSYNGYTYNEAMFKTIRSEIQQQVIKNDSISNN